MIKLKTNLRYILFFLAIFCIFPVQLFSQNKTVVVIYDDSGSMGNGEGSKCHSAAYAIQVMTAFLQETDVLYVVKMSDVRNPIQIDLRNIAAEMKNMERWACNSGTPIQSVHTGMQIIDNIQGEDKSFVMFTDGAFSSFTDNDRNAISNFILSGEAKVILLNIDQPHSEFASWLGGHGVASVYHASSAPHDIIDKMERISANLMSLSGSGLPPQSSVNNVVELNFVYPLKRLIVLEQTSTGSGSAITKAMHNTLPLDVSTSYTARKDNLTSKITHVRHPKKGSVIQPGLIRFTFQNNVGNSNIRFFPEVALTLDVDVIGYMQSIRGNLYEICEQDPDVEVQARLKDYSNNVIEQVLLQQSEVYIQNGSKKERMALQGDFFVHRMTVTGPMSFYISAEHRGYYYFQSRLMNIALVKCPVYSLPQDIIYPEFKVTESDSELGILIRPLIDGVPVDLGHTSDLQLRPVGHASEFVDITATQEGWYVKYRQDRCVCFAKTGLMPVKLELYHEGRDRVIDETNFEIQVQNVCFLIRCMKLILFILGIFLFIWYIIGIIKKPRFSRQYNIFYRYQDGDRVLIAEPNRFRTGFFKRWLIPYSPERKKVERIVFKAHRRKGLVLISKHSIQSVPQGDKVFLGGIEQHLNIKKDLSLREKEVFEIREPNGRKHLFHYIKTSENNKYY